MLLRSYETDSLEKYLTKPEDEAAFVKSMCTGLSKSCVFIDALNVDTTVDTVRSALDECVVTRNRNQQFLNNYLDSITTFVCRQSDCSA